MKYECDICIVGGGAAGVAAAVAVSREGLSTLLVESREFLGGLATAAMVGTVCGLYLRSHRAPPRLANAGFCAEFTTVLQARSGGAPLAYLEGLHFLPYSISCFQELCKEILQQQGVQLCTQATLCNAARSSSKITNLTITLHNTVAQITPLAIIDCSGDAAVARAAQLPVRLPTEAQAPALVFEASGIPNTDPVALRHLLQREIVRGVQRNQLPPESYRLSIVPGTVKDGSALFKLGLPRSFLHEGELRARELCKYMVAYLHDNVPELATLTIKKMAPSMGVRTGAQIEGRAILSTDTVRNALKSPSGIANGSWPIELWGDAREPEMEYFAESDFYQIPAGALCADQIDNLFMAGRTLCAEERAIASARVIGTCLATGFAAGVLAAGAVKKRGLENSIKIIQEAQCQL